jgi:uncharacterized membrane protein YeaQ/YmgE (transglycosylase-associated protein family)
MYAIIQDVTNQPINFSVNTTLGQIVTWAIIGVIAGLLASLLVHGRGMRLLTSLIVGLIGALVGGFLFSLLHIQIGGALSFQVNLSWGDIIAAFVGALIVLLLYRLVFRGRP